jgi:hypothetical protein
MNVSNSLEIWSDLERDHARWAAAFARIKTALTATLASITENRALAVLILNDIFEGQLYPGASELIYRLADRGAQEPSQRKEFVHRQAMEILDVDTILQIVVEASLYFLYFDHQRQTAKHGTPTDAAEGLLGGWALTKYSTGKLLDIDSYEEFVRNYEQVADNVRDRAD